MNPKLRKWLEENCEVKSDASDSDFQAALGKALATGALSSDKYTELAQTKESSEFSEFKTFMKQMSDSVTQLSSEVKALKSGATATADEDDDAEDKKEKNKAKGTEPKETKEEVSWHKSIKRLMRVEIPMEDDGVSPRVKGAWESYSTTKSALLYPSETKSNQRHPFAGQIVKDYDENGRTIDAPSELDKAVAGAYAKFLCATRQRGGSKTFGLQALPEHDRELMFYAMDKMAWGGATDGGDFADIKNRRLSPGEQKALIDDATSGGIEAAPIVFDDMVIQTPLLFGELFPLVNTVPLDRGRRIEGVVTGTVTSSWGGVDNTAISLFNTNSYVSAFDTTIFRWEGAIRVGLDFLSETPIDFGNHITQQYGERLLEDLDDVIAVGNGSTQPEGIINKAGTTSVAFGGATSIGNYESLRFAVNKAEHKGGFAASAVFCGTETSYQRVRALPVGASDARRLFGSGTVGGTSGLDSYSILDRPFKINESLSNAQVFYAILKRYRMYRRRGLVMRTSTEGDTLIRNNEMLMIAMARYGGQLERGAAASKTTTAPA